jgi:hypothetical protein
MYKTDEKSVSLHNKIMSGVRGILALLYYSAPFTHRKEQGFDNSWLHAWIPVAGVLDEPYSQLIPLRGVAV